MKNIIIFSLGLFCLFGGISLMGSDLFGGIAFTVISLILIFLSRAIFYDYKIKKKKEIIRDYDLKIEQLYRRQQQLEKEIETQNNQLLQLSSKIENEKIFKEELLKEIDELVKKKVQKEKETSKYSIDYVDNLDGLEFEEYVKNLLQNIGYTNLVKTQASNDFGIDVIAEKDGIKYAIQCKNYSSPLGNHCVQEAYSGKQFYNCHVGIVLTNSTFTKQAIDLAKKNGILLWDRNKLISMIKESEKYSNNEIKKEVLEEEFKQKEQLHDNYEEPLYNEIVEFVVTQGKASAALLQRRFYFGYNRAARCIDLLEERGIIGPSNGAKPREVLVTIDDIMQRN